MPLAFRQLQGVNLKDRMQCIYQVFPFLCYGKATIDYFLAHIVFSKEMKQYPHKLSTSGWDIGKRKSLVTTGFSGTNDSKRVLPRSRRTDAHERFGARIPVAASQWCRDHDPDDIRRALVGRSTPAVHGPPARSISETHAELRRSMPLWTVQGRRFVRQEKIWKEISKDGVTSLSKLQAEKLLDEEAQSIDHRYRPCNVESHPARLARSMDKDLRSISKCCREFDGLSFNASTLQEEQERELSPETEAEREVPKPRTALPSVHMLHKDVTTFALSGTLVDGSKAYMPAFKSLRRNWC